MQKTINEWAEAVSRLVEDTDAREIAEVAKKLIHFKPVNLVIRNL